MAVPLGTFLAKRDGGRVDFVWQTVTELGTAGFNLFSEVDGVRTRLNGELILSTVIDSVEPVEPVDYSARFASDAEAFYLEEVEIGGRRELYGPFELGRAVGAVVGNGGGATTQSIYLPFVMK